MDAALVYSPGYDFELPDFAGGSSNVLEFDGHRASRALALFRNREGTPLVELEPVPVTRAELEEVHASAYLDRLDDPRTRPAEVAELLEIPAAAGATPEGLEHHYLAPMRLGVGGTLVAMRWALERCRAGAQAPVAFNLSGGYHHAARERGSGFCAYNDLALAAALAAREFGLERILCVDLDAHQGNGTARLFAKHGGWNLLDLFNADIWPDDEAARTATCWPRPLAAGTTGPAYLKELERGLDAAFATAPEFVLYNAGTDVLATDPLGGLSLTLADTAERDRRVLARARQARVPLITCASGGYSDQSHQALAALLAATC